MLLFSLRIDRRRINGFKTYGLRIGFETTSIGLEEKMELTERRQGIHKVMSVFDMRIGNVLDLPDHITIRVMFIYDKESQIKEFRVLDNSISPETKLKIHGWLQEMIVEIKDIQSFCSSEMDKCRFLKAGNY